MNFRVLIVGSLLMLLVTTPISNKVEAQMTSSNFEIRFDSLGVGGDDSSSSASYRLRDSIGGNAEGDGSSTTYNLTSGYRQGIFDRVATFETFSADRTTETAITVLSSTVATVNSVSGYSVGDMIFIVQDQGASQVTGFGKITDITGSDITLDAITTLGGSLSIDGTSDYVYNASGTTSSFGSMAAATVSTAPVGWEVDVDTDDGYGVYVYEDTDLQLVLGENTFTISDVADGTVTAAAGEYGARSSDTTLAGTTFDTEDDGFTTTQQLVGSRSSSEQDSRDFVVLKASMTAIQQGGTYSHTLTFVYVGDY